MTLFEAIDIAKKFNEEIFTNTPAMVEAIGVLIGFANPNPITEEDIDNILKLSSYPVGSFLWRQDLAEAINAYYLIDTPHNKPEPITGKFIRKMDFTLNYNEMAEAINNHFLGKKTK